MIVSGLYRAIFSGALGPIFWFFGEACYTWTSYNSYWIKREGVSSWKECPSAFLAVRSSGSIRGSIVLQLIEPRREGHWYIEVVPSSRLEFVVLTGKACNLPEGKDEFHI